VVAAVMTESRAVTVASGEPVEEPELALEAA
jgi:hypothetical protein